MTFPWAAATATGVGSMPGTSPREAARVIAGELAGFLHVAELPARGPGADVIGRTGGLLASVDSGLGMETTPDGWRFASGRGRQMRLASSFLGEDLDALEENAAGYTGPVKCQVAGPWTLAAAVELPTGERALRDEGATAEITQALAEAVRAHVADVRRRLPTANAVVVQLDEPSLAAVLAGRIGTASGLSSYRAIDPQVAGRALATVIDAGTQAGAVVGVHCCAPDIPIGTIRAAGAAFVSLDLGLLDDARDDALGQAWEAGLGILAGCVPSVGSGPLGDTQASAPLRDVMHRLGLDDDRWLASVAVTPTCGLAGASPDWARTALAACRAVGRVLRHDESEAGEDGHGG